MMRFPVNIIDVMIPVYGIEASGKAPVRYSISMRGSTAQGLSFMI